MFCDKCKISSRINRAQGGLYSYFSRNAYGLWFIKKINEYVDHLCKIIIEFINENSINDTYLVSHEFMMK